MAPQRAEGEEVARRIEAEEHALVEAENTHGVLSWQAGDRRARVRDTGCELLLNHFACAQAHSIESLVWRATCHRPISAMRSAIDAEARRGGSSVRKLSGQLHSFLDHAERYYEHLATRLFAGSTGAQHSPNASVAKCYSYLGDLSRYRQHLRSSSSRDWSQAAERYHASLRFDPSNGSPRNQLAVLATQTEDDLSATFFYCAALASENPFSTARENVPMLMKRARHRYGKMSKRCSLHRNSGNKPSVVLASNNSNKKAPLDESLATVMRQSFVEVMRCVLEGRPRRSSEEAFSLLHASLSELGCNMCAPILAQDPLAQGATAALEMVATAVFGVELAAELVEEEHQNGSDKSNNRIVEAREMAVEALHVTAKRAAALARTLLADGRTSEAHLALPCVVVFLEYQEAFDYCVNPLPKRNGKANKRKRTDSECSAWPDIASALSEVSKACKSSRTSSLAHVTSTKRAANRNYWPALPEDTLLAGCKKLSHAHSRVYLDSKPPENETVESARLQRLLALGETAATNPARAPLAVDASTGNFTVASGMPSILVNGRTMHEQYEFEQQVKQDKQVENGFVNGDVYEHDEPNADDALNAAAGVAQFVDDDEDDEEIVWSPAERQSAQSYPYPQQPHINPYCEQYMQEMHPAHPPLQVSQYQPMYNQNWPQPQSQSPKLQYEQQKQQQQQQQVWEMYYAQNQQPPQQFFQPPMMPQEIPTSTGEPAMTPNPWEQKHHYMQQQQQQQQQQQHQHLMAQASDHNNQVLLHQLQQAAAPDGNALFGTNEQPQQQYNQVSRSDFSSCTGEPL